MTGWIQEIAGKPNVLDIESITGPTLMDFEVNGQTINVEFVSLTSGYRITIDDQKYSCDTATGIAIVGNLESLSQKNQDTTSEFTQFLTNIERYKISEF